jgi:sugar lactone lactonase YvrE
MYMRILGPLAIVLATVGCDTPQDPPTPLALSVLATGANIAGANGIIFSPDNQLYAASVIGSNITIMDPDSGEILRQLGASDGVSGPDDIDFAPDGSFYWTSILTGEVAGLTPNGERIQAANLGAGVNPITFSDDGRLFVAQCFFGTGLFEVDPKGVIAQ